MLSPRSNRSEQLAQLARGTGLDAVPFGSAKDIGQGAGDKQLLVAEGAAHESSRGGADPGAAHADVEHVVVAGRSHVLELGLAHEQVAVEARHGLGVGHAERPPVAGDGGVEVHEVVAVEDDSLGVDLGPADAEPLDRSGIRNVA
jgi:hypothetical protein